MKARKKERKKERLTENVISTYRLDEGPLATAF